MILRPYLQLILGTSEVAELLAVHPSTVKRWSDDGHLPADKTDGGHRRFHLGDVLGGARERGVRTYLDPFTPYEAHVWSAVEDIRNEGSYRRLHALAMGWVTRGHHDRVGRLFATLAEHPSLELTDLLDHGVRGLMERVGDAWRDGRLRVGEEHLVSQTLMEVLLCMRRLPEDDDGSPEADDAPWAVVGATDGDQHHIGALCVRLVLERAGWRTLYLGPSVPVEDFASVQRARSADLVCISFSPTGTGTDPHRSLRILESLYEASSPYALALGGGAAGDPAEGDRALPFREVGRFASCASFLQALEEGFGAPSRPGAGDVDRPPLVATAGGRA